MVNQLDNAGGIRSLDDMADMPPSSGSLTNEEMSAAGWLSEALSEPVTPVAAVQALQLKPVSGVRNMGDAILSGLMKVSSSYTKTASEMHASIENGAGSPGIMGALQMHMSFIEVSLQADTVSKCISKSEQSIEQLVKQQ